MPVDGAFRWVSSTGGHARPAQGRALYRLVGRDYRYAGEQARWCANCGSALFPFESKRPPVTCSLCGKRTELANGTGFEESPRRKDDDDG